MTYKTKCDTKRPECLVFDSSVDAPENRKFKIMRVGKGSIRVLYITDWPADLELIVYRAVNKQWVDSGKRISADRSCVQLVGPETYGIDFAQVEVMQNIEPPVVITCETCLFEETIQATTKVETCCGPGKTLHAHGPAEDPCANSDNCYTQSELEQIIINTITEHDLDTDTFARLHTPNADGTDALGRPYVAGEKLLMLADGSVLSLKDENTQVNLEAGEGIAIVEADGKHIITNTCCSTRATCGCDYPTSTELGALHYNGGDKGQLETHNGRDWVRVNSNMLRLGMVLECTDDADKRIFELTNLNPETWQDVTETICDGATEMTAAQVADGEEVDFIGCRDGDPDLCDPDQRVLPEKTRANFAQSVRAVIYTDETITGTGSATDPLHVDHPAFPEIPEIPEPIDVCDAPEITNEEAFSGDYFMLVCGPNGLRKTRLMPPVDSDLTACTNTYDEANGLLNRRYWHGFNGFDTHDAFLVVQDVWMVPGMYRGPGDHVMIGTTGFEMVFDGVGPAGVPDIRPDFVGIGTSGNTFRFHSDTTVPDFDITSNINSIEFWAQHGWFAMPCDRGFPIQVKFRLNSGRRINEQYLAIWNGTRQPGLTSADDTAFFQRDDTGQPHTIQTETATMTIDPGDKVHFSHLCLDAKGGTDEMRIEMSVNGGPWEQITTETDFTTAGLKVSTAY